MRAAQHPAEAVTGDVGGLEALADVRVPVSVVLGTGTVTVRQCLALDTESVLRLAQPAGADLQLAVNGVVLARGEVVVAEDTTAIRLTEIARSPERESRA